MLQGSLSLFLMRLFSQMYKCHKPQKHYHKTWLHKSSVSLYCVTRISILFLGHFTLHPPGPTHSSQASLYSTVITKQSSESEWRVMACTLWLHKARPGKHTFSSHRLIIRAFCTGDKRESRRGEIWQHRHSQGLLHLLHHTQHLASPVYGLPCYNKNMGTL